MDTEDVRLAVYRSFVLTGRPPEPDQLDVQALRELHEQRHVVLGADDEIRMAHPFSAIPLGFSVMGRETLWWGGCAWDSFALPHLLPDEPEVLVATPAIRNLVREGKTHQIYSTLQAGAQHGMSTMDSHLAELVRRRTITYDEALDKCHHVEEFLRLCSRRAGA